MEAYEINFDGLVGPTHNYSGLAYGNLASMAHGSLISSPKQAALQGLAKMRTLMRLGIKQAILPPHERPYLPFLRSIGYRGTERDILKQAAESPDLIRACTSSAHMWTANAATVSPSADSSDGRVHLTPANLISQLHRSFESDPSTLILKKIFKDPSRFAIHNPLPLQLDFADEGAANHTRFCNAYSSPGIQLFVFGRSSFNKKPYAMGRFPARQTREASEAIARLHLLSDKQTIFAQQNPAAIEAGVFHNDVIAVGNQHLFFYHADAFLDTSQTIQTLEKKFRDCCKSELETIEVSASKISLQTAVSTYLFNSQLITLPDQSMTLIAPIECQQSPVVNQYLQELVDSKKSSIRHVMYLDVRESMCNGGGPACLRCRIVLTEQERQAVLSSIFLTETLYLELVEWIERHYRDQLTPQDLADPDLALESQRALDELSYLLNLGSIYSFQL